MKIPFTNKKVRIFNDQLGKAGNKYYYSLENITDTSSYYDSIKPIVIKGNKKALIVNYRRVTPFYNEIIDGGYSKFTKETYFFKENGLWGIMDGYGKILTPPKYNYINSENGIFYAFLNSKKVKIDVFGRGID